MGRSLEALTDDRTVDVTPLKKLAVMARIGSVSFDTVYCRQTVVAEFLFHFQYFFFFVSK